LKAERLAGVCKGILSRDNSTSFGIGVTLLEGIDGCLVLAMLFPSLD
jgi:hypothetical protein